VTQFLNLCPNHIFGIGEVRQLKSCVVIHTEEYSCMHDTLPLKMICSESRDHFKFKEITDNISLTWKIRGIVAMEH